MTSPHGGLSTEHIDYLQRASAPVAPSPDSPITAVPVESRRSLWISRIGRPPLDPSEPVKGPPEGHLRATDVLAGLHALKCPTSFCVRASDGAIRVEWGVWAPSSEGASAGVLSAREQLLATLLSAAYPAIAIQSGEPVISIRDRAAVVLGVPSRGSWTPRGEPAPLDRLLRGLGSMHEGEWEVLVLAQPIDEGASSNLRDAVINEMRAVQTEWQARTTPSPLAEHLLALLGAALQDLTDAAAVGAWRTAAYLSGEGAAFHRLTAAYRAVHGGEDSLPEPLRVHDLEGAAELAPAWALPDLAAEPGPGAYRHPFALQTVLSSGRLAALFRLPEREVAGFQIVSAPAFDVVSKPVEGDRALEVGTIYDNGGPTRSHYRVQLDSLTRHVLVAGTTGSGKTNTVLNLLSQIARAGVPFLIIEPAKTEYRALLTAGLGDQLQVFTLGDETMAPFRINPFEAPAGTPIQAHLDRLKAIFFASFVMYAPMPYVLERCLVEVYVDRGWDLVTGRCARGESQQAFPTLADLQAKIAVVVEALGYHDRLTRDLTAALETRVQSLRLGGKGRMLDTRRSIPIADILAGPALLELDAMGDDDEKAFVLGLLLTALYEHRRAEGPSPGGRLRHLTVIEEAHRLLRARPQSSDPEGNTLAGKSVETFAGMLAEVRAYGEGILIAEQIPTKLAPDVLKNTNLKITHRLVDEVERNAVGRSMAFDDEQILWLAACPVGQGVVFGGGDDRPLRVQVPRATSADTALDTIDQALAIRSAHVRERYADVLTAYPWAPASHPANETGEGVFIALESTEIRAAFGRWVRASAFSDEGFFQGREDVKRIYRRLARTGTLAAAWDSLVGGGLARTIDDLGREHAVPFTALLEVQRAFVATALETGDDATGELTGLRALLGDTFSCPEPPFPQCEWICPDRACWFRQTSEKRVVEDRLPEAVLSTLKEAKGPEVWQGFKELFRRSSMRSLPEGVQESSEAARRSGLCTAVHSLHAASDLSPTQRGRLLDGFRRIFEERVE